VKVTIDHYALEKLESMLITKDLDAFIITNNTKFALPFNCEDLNLLSLLTGFDGSKGCALLMSSKIGMKSKFFTDGRYLLQASKQLDSTKFDIYDTSDLDLFSFLRSSWKIGYIDSFHSLSFYQKVSALCGCMIAIDLNFIVDLISVKYRAKNSPVKAFTYDERYAGLDVETKIKLVTNEMKLLNYHLMLMDNASDVSWMLNIRSSYNLYTPIVPSFGLINQNNKVDIFVDKYLIDIDQALSDNLKIFGVNIYDESDIESVLNVYENNDYNFAISRDISMNLWNAVNNSNINKKNIVFLNNSICTNIRSIKTNREIDNSRSIHVQDSVALINFLTFINNNWESEQITEYEAAQKLLEFRRHQKDFYGPSFPTISAFGANGAIIHYTPKKDHCNILGRSKNDDNNAIHITGGMYLLDSGGHYFGGTTDVTRTIFLGQPSPIHRFHYTLVLKAHIALARTVLPIGEDSMRLDSIARSVLWKQKMVYKHGTGHGVSNFLSVHEIPPSISAKVRTKIYPMQIFSNEPGFYVNDEYGIRLENLLYVQSIDDDFCHFVNLTLVPFDRKLIDLTMLDIEEISWLQEYNKEIYKKIGPHLNDWSMKYLEDAIKL
jgi:Xaa-Pro aminopeptidase